MRADLALAGALLGVFALAAWEAQAFRWQAAVAPLLAAGCGAVLSLALIVDLLRTRAAADPGYDRRDLAGVAGFLAAVGAVLLFGFALGGAAFVFGYLKLVARRRVATAALAAAAVPVFVWVLAEVVLATTLFGGFVFHAFGW